ncbi:MAG: hypothetical protein RMJ32_06175, partial [Aquificaceae bacterium]|nr:hypothetical protein [Aquificaceae bacterium]
TVSCRTPLVEYLNPMPAYELSEEKLYQELLKFIKDEGYKTFDEFEKAISLKAKPVKLAIENSLVVSGPQIEFQERLIQKAQELLSNVSPAEVVQEVDRN